MRIYKYIIAALFFLIIFGCEKDTTSFQSSIPTTGTDDEINQDRNGGWLIPQDDVVDGGPGKDGIPALTNPEIINASAAAFLSDDDLVLGFYDGIEARAYPHSILNYHEIINDDIGDNSVAIIYCPLTGTGIGWNRELGGSKTTFGVSGLLYNSNLIPYDRATDSYWSQILLKSVRGQHSGENAHVYNLIETTWRTWKTLFPSTKVVSTNTGHSRNYDVFPYGNYRSNNVVYFPVDNKDTRLSPKERVLGVLISDQAKAYSFDVFYSVTQTGSDVDKDLIDPISVINDTLNNKDIVVIGSQTYNFAVAYKRTMSDGTSLEFQPVQDGLPIVMIDSEGTSWNIMGRAVSGPRAGTQLSKINQFIGYWFAWAAFYPDIELYE